MTQKKAMQLLHHCLQLKNVYDGEKEYTIKALFGSIPHINNLCHIQLSKCFIVLTEGISAKNKENVFRELLEYQPYTKINAGIKEIVAKFMAFAVDSGVERYIKGCIADLTELRWKDDCTDTALHLELRFQKWKMEHKRNLKEKEVKQ